MFAHALMRESLLARLGATRRAHLHAAVADALLPLLPADPTAPATARQPLAAPPADILAAVARHYAAAAPIGRARDAVDYGWQAARQAADVAAWEEAAEHLERVLVARSQIDPETKTCPDQLWNPVVYADQSDMRQIITNLEATTRRNLRRAIVGGANWSSCDHRAR
jgi:hypothetical protein